jgi:hypothetical protein
MGVANIAAADLELTFGDLREIEGGADRGAGRTLLRSQPADDRPVTAAVCRAPALTR